MYPVVASFNFPCSMIQTHIHSLFIEFLFIHMISLVPRLVRGKYQSANASSHVYLLRTETTTDVVMKLLSGLLEQILQSNLACRL